MSDMISTILQWLNTHPELSWLLTFVISAAESVAIIGTIVPGSIMMTAVGVLAGSGVIPLWPTIIWAILGAIVGDGISYWIGYYFRDRLPNVWPFKAYPGILDKGEIFFKKYGSMSVFIGRFVGPVRALVPLVAGMLGMKPWKFTIANVTSAIGWAPAYMLPGILLGAASLELPADIAVHIILVLFLLCLFALLCLWFIYKLLALATARIERTQNALWLKLQQSSLFKPITFLLKSADPNAKHGQLNLAIYLLMTAFFFIALILYVKIVHADTIWINQVFFHLFRGIRVQYVDNMMLDITLLAQKEVILPVILTVFFWLLLIKRKRPAYHVLVFGILIAGSVFIIKNVFRLPRPWGILHSPETYSMPSGHTLLAVGVYLGLAFFARLSIKKQYRFLLLIPLFLLVLLISISRLYLGAHWFTDVLASWLLGSAILIFITLSYRREAEKPVPALGLILVTVATLLVTYPVFYHFNNEKLTLAYTQVDWPATEINLKKWWQSNQTLSIDRTNIFGFPSQKINIEWLGNEKNIRETLHQNGWQKPPSRDLISTIHRLADVRSGQFLPMISPRYQDDRPDIIFTQTQKNGDTNLFIIRLWKANIFIKNVPYTFWVGTIGIVPTTYSWLYQTHARKQMSYKAISFPYLFPKQKLTSLWDYKTLTTMRETFTHKLVPQKILLIRPKNLK